MAALEQGDPGILCPNDACIRFWDGETVQGGLMMNRATVIHAL